MKLLMKSATTVPGEVWLYASYRPRINIPGDEKEASEVARSGEEVKRYNIHESYL